MAKIQKDSSKQDLVDQFNNRFRYLDDVLALNNPDSISEIYDKRDDFSFPIVNFPFLDWDVSLAPSYGFTFHN